MHASTQACANTRSAYSEGVRQRLFGRTVVTVVELEAVETLSFYTKHHAELWDGEQEMTMTITCTVDSSSLRGETLLHQLYLH